MVATGCGCGCSPLGSKNRTELNFQTLATTGEEVDGEMLGSGLIHSSKSGVTNHLYFYSETYCWVVQAALSASRFVSDNQILNGWILKEGMTTLDDCIKKEGSGMLKAKQ